VFRSIEDFLRTYEGLTAGTERVFSALTDDNLEQAITPEHRNLGQLGWHLVVTIPEMMGRTGLAVSSVDPHSRPPVTAAPIRKGYHATSGELMDAVRSGWTDESLLVTDDMYGEPWPRGMTLLALIHHEIHHRAQMTVLLRQAGARVPGVFGPSKEEWARFGMEAPAY
jgi:uncharacterized damage-inducible protein DinB